MTGPVAAQTTITSLGLAGQTACGSGYVHQNDNVDIGTSTTSVINSGGTQQLTANNFFRVNYSILSAGVGDGGSSSFPMKLRVINTRTGSIVRTADVGTVTSTDASAPRQTESFTLTAKTPYVAIYYADVTEWGLQNPISTFCFMTGGDYTIRNNSLLSMIMKSAVTECTVEGQLGNEAKRRNDATAKLNSIFGSESNYMQITSTNTCDDKCDERFPRFDSASMRAKNACYDQCRAAASSTPSWATLVANEVAAIERTFDPAKCRAPEADQPQTNGCYSISPRTPLDVKNCLCGRTPRPTGCDTI